MPTTLDSLIDTSVLIDLLDDDSPWHRWASQTFLDVGADGRVILNPMVLSETAPGYTTLEAFDARIGRLELEGEDLPWEAAFLAGRAFAAYRRSGGPRDSLPPDFYIGAHAAVGGYRILTRDPRRIQTYFPSVTLIAPP